MLENVNKDNLEIIEEAALTSIRNIMALEIEHMLKIEHITPGKGGWANSVFKAIYDIKRVYLTSSDRAELGNDNTVNDLLNDAYEKGKEKAKEQNPGKENLFSEIRPPQYNFALLTSFDNVREYLIANIADPSMSRYINSSYATYVDRRINKRI